MTSAAEVFSCPSTAIRDGSKQAAHNINHAITHPIETLTNCAQSAIILADFTGADSALENSGLLSMSLEERIAKQMEACQQLDVILDKMRSMSPDDVARELIAWGLEAGAFGIAFRGMAAVFN